MFGTDKVFLSLKFVALFFYNECGLVTFIRMMDFRSFARNANEAMEGGDSGECLD